MQRVFFLFFSFILLRAYACAHCCWVKIANWQREKEVEIRDVERTAFAACAQHIGHNCKMLACICSAMSFVLSLPKPLPKTPGCYAKI